MKAEVDWENYVAIDNTSISFNEKPICVYVASLKAKIHVRSRLNLYGSFNNSFDWFGLDRLNIKQSSAYKR